MEKLETRIARIIANSFGSEVFREFAPIREIRVKAVFNPGLSVFIRG
jgi:hypothetical protein